MAKQVFQNSVGLVVRISQGRISNVEETWWVPNVVYVSNLFEQKEQREKKNMSSIKLCFLLETNSSLEH